jgi:hypothetical protein
MKDVFLDTNNSSEDNEISLKINLIKKAFNNEVGQNNLGK